MTIAALTTGDPAAPTPCPTCGRPLPVPSLPQLCPVCLGEAINPVRGRGEPVALPRLSLTSTSLPAIRRVLRETLLGVGMKADQVRALVDGLGAPIRFCDSSCRRHFHAAVDRDEQDLDPQPGRCWFCRCALPDAPPDERYFLAHAAASESYHYGTSYTVLVVGDIQVIAVEADDLAESMDRYFAGMHLAAREPFATIAEAYVMAVADLHRRGHQRPEPAYPIIYLALTNGVTAQAHAIDRDGLPALEVRIQAANQLVPSWVIRTGQQHVREVDRLLRGMGVLSATMIGAKLWVELGLPLPATRS